jgi:signal transduction histidine kinase
MERGDERMDDLNSDLLSLARQGKTTGERTEVDPTEVATDAWESIDAGSARLEVAAAGHVHADEGRLSELFENLYRNAIEHGGGDVTVRVGGLPDRDGFFIEDDGPGIPEEDRENALEHGYTTADDGTGLGLTIVDSIVEAHGWSLDIRESTEGGARFEITATDDGQQAVLDHATGSP